MVDEDEDDGGVGVPPRMTLKMSLFIASHIIVVRIAPLNPIKAPMDVSKGFDNKNPSAVRAQPL